MEQNKFVVYKAYLHNNPRFGRITTVREVSTGRELDLMGNLTKSGAINQFKKQYATPLQMES